MDESAALLQYLLMIDADLALHRRVVVSLADDARAVGIVADRAMLENLGELYRTRGCDVTVDPGTGALEIRARR